MGYLLMLVVVLILGVASQAGISSTYKKWSRVPAANGLPGSYAARNMLDWYGLHSVGISEINGSLTDNFNPKSGQLSLSRDVYETPMVASIAIACHEAGHAVQHAKGYTFAKFRSALVPVVSVASNIWVFLLIIGVFMDVTGFIWAGIVLFAFAVLFQLVTLPVEFDASNRAMQYIQTIGLPPEQVAGCRKVLTAAAMTYVAAALASVIQLLYFTGMARR